LVDDNRTWLTLEKRNLERAGLEVHTASSAVEAYTMVSKGHFDIIVIDMNLGARESGDAVANRLRGLGFSQPIVLASGDDAQLARPIGEFASILSVGPTHFHTKNESGPLATTVMEASRMVDPIRRSLRLMKEAGFGATKFRIDSKVYTVDDLLNPERTNQEVLAQLRESLHSLLVEFIAGQSRNDPK